MSATLKARLEALAKEWRGHRGHWTGPVFGLCADDLDEIIATLGEERVMFSNVDDGSHFVTQQEHDEMHTYVASDCIYDSREPHSTFHVIEIKETA